MNRQGKNLWATHTLSALHYTRSAERFLTFKTSTKNWTIHGQLYTAPDFSASSHHGAPHSLTVDIRALYKFILQHLHAHGHGITTHSRPVVQKTSNIS